VGSGSVGLFAWLRAKKMTQLRALSRQLETEGYFQQVMLAGEDLYVHIGDPESLPPIAAIEALRSAVLVTAGYETSGDPCQQVTGNFDGAGLSYGPMQFNFKSRTLAPLFRLFSEADEDKLKACFTNQQHYEEWKRVLGSSSTKQIQWADQHSLGARKAGFAQPWKGYLQAVGSVPLFRQIMLEHAAEQYGLKLAKALGWLRDLVNVPINHLRCICSLFDLCTQQGSLNRAHTQIQQRVALEHPDDQFEIVQIAVEERGRKANAPWRADCVSRRLGILNRQRTSVTVDGKTASRSNRNFYLLRNVTIRNAEVLYHA
jgi:hypothetical protein